ncbi:MAG: 5-carboxymethyl-2-hydroxymuconate Delta-isomerase [Gemmatimonadetes bacterium]|nr:5-carboxymethyl-2-hydroxymuconate Delta-isomerase [Gemmatimonadota bacterium]
MPHLTLEYSRNLRSVAPSAPLFATLHGVLESVAGISVDNCKSRWREVSDFHVGGGGEDKAFVHLSIRYLEGRPPATQQAVGQAILSVLKENFKEAPDALDLQITVEIEDIRRDTYFKDPPGTLGRPPTLQV